MKTLLLPFQIRCLHLTKPMAVAEASADFSGIPYFDKKEGITVNANTPYLSENILSQPFQNQNLVLDKGVHLHFILPKRLSSTIKYFDENGQVIQKHAPAPNRWLIVKNTDGEASQKWVVESDYLWGENSMPEATLGKITIPLSVDDIKKSTNFSKPFRYMGRVYDFEKWLEDGEKGEYWFDFFQEPLTTLGYGEERFAGFFPNSNGVFSFHDPKENQPLTQTVKYEVWGWYSDKKSGDLLTNFYQKDTTTNENDRLTAFQQEMNWTIENPINSTLPDHFICYSAIELSKNSHTVSLKDAPTEIAFGQQGTEALAAYLAQKIEPNNKSSVEDQLEAIQFDFLQAMKLDKVHKFNEARHSKGFSAKAAGKLWGLELASISNKNLSNSEFSTDIQKITAESQIDDLVYNAAISIASLNFLQYEYDQKQHRIQSKRHQLFADWYKYMFAAHPPIGQERKYPKADDILQFINHFVIHDLHDVMEKTGVILSKYDENATSFEDNYQFSTEFENSISSEFVDITNELKGDLQELNQTLKELQQEKNTPEAIQNGQSEYRFPTLVNLKLGYRLVSKPAPRFYEANEPVVLLAGNLTKSTTPLLPDALSCYETDWDLTNIKSFLPTLFRAILEVKMNNTLYTIRDLMPVRKIDQSDWHPTFLEWEVAYHAVDDPSDMPAGYPTDFIENNFELSSDVPDFLLKKVDKNVFSKKTRYYRGSTILTAYAKKALNQKLQNFTKRNQLDNNHPIRKAQALLNETSVLSQSLGGFNHALLMRQQTMQLEIDDPISLKSYQPLIENIRDFIGDAVKSAPEPSNYFNPIRAGGLDLVRLRLIDSFGQTIEVFNKDAGHTPIVANTLTPPPSLQGSFQSLLAPRIVQPSRLSLRWVAAEDDQTKSTTHASTSPICGWIIPNFLDQSIALYTQEGDQLGSLAYIDDNVYPVPKINKSEFLLSEIKNIHFYHFAQYIIYHGEDFFFDFLGELRDSLEYIDPENSAQHGTMSLLVSRPLAIVRAKIDLELMEDPAINQDWNLFQKDLVNATNLNHKRETYDFEKVKIPFRLGDPNQLNDGVIGFWKDGKKADHIDGEDYFYMPNAHKSSDAYQSEHDYIITGDNADYLMYQSLADEPQYLTFLFDPRAQLNVVSGVLPTKTIDIPTLHWKKALENLRVDFLIAPILTPKDRFQMPLPQEAGHQWHFTFFQNKKLKEIPSIATIDRFKLEKTWDSIGGKDKYYLWGTLIASNWINPLEEDVTKAHINYDLATRQELPKEYDETKIKELLSALYQGISPVVTDVQFGQVELREGWLKIK